MTPRAPFNRFSALITPAILFCAVSVTGVVFASPGEVLSHQKISNTEGGFTGGLDDSDNFGSSATSLGDLDGDLVGDVAVGAFFDDDGGPDRGAVWILFLNDDGTVKAHQKISDTEGGFTGVLDDSVGFGSSVASLGDLDGDLVGDVAVGAELDGDGGPGRGAVWILFLNADGTVKTHQKISDTEGGFTGVLDDSDSFGGSVASLGDLDGDLVADLAVGARGDDDGGSARGAVWILFLNDDGTVKAHQKISDTEGGFTGTLDDVDLFGTSVVSLGDLDRDLVGDLAVGAPTDDDGGSARGAVWILFLNADGTVKAHQKISDTEGGFTGVLDDSDAFGRSGASLGDVDGDLVGDLAVGASRDDDGGSSRGAVWILFLNGNGTVKTHQKISDTEGRFTGVLDDDDYLGYSMASLGDLDGDRVGDLAVGANEDDDGGLDRGAVWVLYLDGSLRVTSPRGGEIWPVGALRTVSWAGAEGPLNLLLSVDGGRTFDKLHSGLAGTEFVLRVPHAPTRYALVRLEQDTPAADADADSFFTISSEVTLLRFRSEPAEGGGVALCWETDPGVEDLAGYSIERRAVDRPWISEVALTRGTTHRDPQGGPSTRYRLFSVNGLGGELLLGEISGAFSGALQASPAPYRGGKMAIRFASTSRLGGGPGHTKLVLYDARGRLVRRIAEGFYPAGIHGAVWDGLDEAGRPVPAGIYHLHVDSEGQTGSVKVTVLR